MELSRAGCASHHPSLPLAPVHPPCRQGLSLVSVRTAGSAADQRTEGANLMPAASVLAHLHASVGREGVPRFLAAVAASLPLSL